MTAGKFADEIYDENVYKNTRSVKNSSLLWS